MVRLISLTLLVACCATPLAAAQPRNVVMMVVDDQGLDAGCYGNDKIDTPNLDALAAEGTLFLNAFCTTASCSASRSVILSGLHNHANGQYGHQHGYNNFHTLKSVRALPLLLADVGYRTCSIGKFHVQPERLYHFEKYANGGLDGGSRSTVQMAENAEKFIRENDDRPFFIYFCTGDPHRDRNGFANHRQYPGVVEHKHSPDEVIVPHFLPDSQESREELAEYYQAVNRCDQGLGRLIQALKNTGHWEDTMVLYLSDNGIPFPGAKTNLYDPGMRLPLVVRSPDQKIKGVRSQAMVSWVDLVPTILEFTKAEGPKYKLHGRSFLSVLEEENPPGRNEVFASHTFHEITMYYPMRVIRTDRYKYVLNLAHQLPFPFASDLFSSPTWQGVLKRQDSYYGSRTVEAYIHRPRHELYDLKNDPREVENLAEHPDHAKVLTELQAKLKTFQEQTKDPWIVKYRYE